MLRRASNIRIVSASSPGLGMSMNKRLNAASGENSGVMYVFCPVDDV